MNSLVTVLVPERNEKKHIKECLDSILSQTYGNKDLEVFIIDGMSNDGTRDIVNAYCEKYPFIYLLDNPDRIVPKALNIGLKKAKGDIIVRLDAHTYYDENYIERCVQNLKKTGADNVGGRIVTLPGAKTNVAKAIGLATSNVFGVGNSKFRTTKKAQYVDTVAFGAFKRSIFDKIGFFNEILVRNQDIELNSRIIQSGGKIFLDPEIVAYYYNQSTLFGLWKQNFGNGRWNVFTLAINKKGLSLRHFIPFAFVMSLLSSFLLTFLYSPFGKLFALIASSYILVNIIASIATAVKAKEAKLILLLSVTFAILHFSYGIGYFFGFIGLRSFRKTMGGL